MHNTIQLHTITIKIMSERFYGVPNGVAFCQQERTEELSRRMRERNIPSAPLQPQLGARPVLTKYTIMPILDQRKEATVPLMNYPIYNPEQVFNQAARLHHGPGMPRQSMWNPLCAANFLDCRDATKQSMCRHPKATFTMCALTRAKFIKRIHSCLGPKGLHP